MASTGSASQAISLPASCAHLGAGVDVAPRVPGLARIQAGGEAKTGTW
jgi:hypothetical protein